MIEAMLLFRTMDASAGCPSEGSGAAVSRLYLRIPVSPIRGYPHFKLGFRGV